jgi:GNAT superfamily N-acetyltransferase
MVALPGIGTRVSVRFRRPPGAVPPLSDVVGHLRALDPVVRVETKTGEVVEFAADDVVTVRRLTDVPVRNSQIRAVEYAAALAWPGTEHQWLDGWLLRAGHGATWLSNSAVPLAMHASLSAVPTIVDWYAQRSLAPRLTLPDRLVPLSIDTAVERETRMLVCQRPALEHDPDPEVSLAPHPGQEWLAGQGEPTPVAELTAVTDGALAFGTRAGVAVGRAALTQDPDGQRWVGLSRLYVTAGARRRGHARAVCATLLSWAAEHGATRGYAQVPDGDSAALGLLESLGFGAQHRCRLVRAEAIWTAPPPRTV